MDFDKFKIKEYKYWTLYLHDNQCFLGRCYIWCKRKDTVDFLEMTDEEQKEFFGILRNLKDVLIKLFKPDLFNYASLGNIATHLHMHVIPRYKTKRNFNNTIFVDERWGKNYAPYNYDFKLGENILFDIKDKISQALEK